MRRLTLVICLVLTAAPLAAEKWTYAASDYFEVYATGGDRQARDAITYFERVHAFFTDVLKLSPKPGKPTRLIVFSSDKQFAPYRPNEVAAAFYLSGPDRDFIVMKSLDDESYPTVVHEYSHLIFRHSGARYPIWLNEGLAEFFSTLSPEGREKMSVGAIPLGTLQYLNDGVTLMALQRLFDVRHDSPEYNTRKHAGVFYAQSWALTHMLLTDSRYRPQSGKFLQVMASGTPSATAIKSIYGKTPDDLGRDLYNYIRQSQYIYLRWPYKSPAETVRPATRAADAFEGALVTANLLANSPGREADARAAFEELAAQKPNDVSLLEARAYFELRRGHRAQALPYFARAVEQGSTNASVYRDYAVFERAKAPALLARAMALAPNDPEVRLAYASSLFSERKAAEAIATLRGAKVLPELAFRTFQLAANAYMQLNQVDDARYAAAEAVKYAQPGKEATYAAQLAKSIDDFESRRAAASRSGGNAPTDAPSAAPPAPGATLNPEQLPMTPASLARLRQEPTVIVTGRIKNIVCAEPTKPILEVETGGRRLRLLIDDPLAITVQGKTSFTADLACVPQDLPVRVGYLPAVDAARKTVGLVRLLDYRQTGN